MLVELPYYRLVVALFVPADLLQECFLVAEYYIYTKNVRSVLATYLTILAFELASSVKISNFEAHADMYTVPLTFDRHGALLLQLSRKGMRINTSRVIYHCHICY